MIRAPHFDDLRALTLTQPWCGLMAAGIKKLENRDRPVIKNDDVLKRPDIVLHASREIDESVYETIAGAMPELGVFTEERTFFPRYIKAGDPGAGWYELARVTSSFLAVVRLTGALYIGGSHPRHVETTLRSMGLHDQACFAFGPTIYIFDNVRPLHPIPSKGKLGWWRLNPEQRDQVRLQVPA